MHARLHTCVYVRKRITAQWLLTTAIKTKSHYDCRACRPTVAKITALCWGWCCWVMVVVVAMVVMLVVTAVVTLVVLVVETSDIETI